MLRRRFGFVELMPNLEPLADASVAGLELAELVRRLNKRIALTASRERQIGQSFFLHADVPITDPAEFAQVFRSEIVPMLQEYAGDDFEQLAEYLGTQIVDVENLELNDEVFRDPSRLLEALEVHLLGGPASAP
jgi:5-methylcytosine-specific restriction enzyme B